MGDNIRSQYAVSIAVCSTTISTVYYAVDSRSLLTLSTAAVAGIVIAALVGSVLLYTCGLLTGLLIERRRKRRSPRESHPTGATSASGDPGTSSQIVYEEVLPPKPATSIPMQENVSYGPLS